ncbi:hypothetical protein U5640_04460 [Streptomyces sp. SS7]|uniref:hypothetical protein n=1 Tax=Streptomyces sp. SS7 TaxID=3108485 RepID=UPI0030EE4DEB
MAAAAVTVGTAVAYYTGAYGRLRALAKVPGADELWLGTSDRGTDKDSLLKVTLGPTAAPAPQAPLTEG